MSEGLTAWENPLFSLSPRSQCCWWLVNTSPVHNLYFWAVTKPHELMLARASVMAVVALWEARSWSPQTCCCNSPSCDVPSLFHFLSRDAPLLATSPHSAVHLNGGTWFPKEPRKCHVLIFPTAQVQGEAGMDGGASWQFPLCFGRLVHSWQSL